MPSIENVPKWAQVRCSGQLTDAEHRNHAHLGIFPMLAGEEVVDKHQASKTCPHGHGFDVRDGRQTLNIETMPRWALFRCSAGGEVVDRCSAGEVDSRWTARGNVVERRVGGGQTAPSSRVSSEGGSSGPF